MAFDFEPWDFFYTDPDTRPGYQTVELSASDASPPTTSITSASLEPNIALNDPGTISPMDTYSAPTQPGVPFPTREFHLQCIPPRSLLITGGPSDPLQDLYSLQQHQGVIH